MALGRVHRNVMLLVMRLNEFQDKGFFWVIMGYHAADMWRLFSVITPPLSSWFLNIITLINFCISQNFSCGCPNSDPVYSPLNLVFQVFNLSSTYYRILFWFSMSYVTLTLTLRIQSSFQDLGQCLQDQVIHSDSTGIWTERTLLLPQCSP